MSGIVHSLPEADYHAHPALSSTGARKLLPPSCPAKFDYERRHPRVPTRAMREGHAAHRMILGVGVEVVPVVGYDDWRTKAAQDQRKEIEAAGSVALLEHDVRRLMAMRDALMRHPIAGRLFDPDRGEPEASLLWVDDETGVECRGRLDFLPNPVDGRRLIIPDYKRSESALPTGVGFPKSAANYGYPMQADWYLRGARALKLDPDPQFVFVAQSDQPPYLVSVTYLTSADLQLAHHRNRIALHTFKGCSERGEWPGYDAVTALPMPTYWRIESETLLESEPA